MYRSSYYFLFVLYAQHAKKELLAEIAVHVTRNPRCLSLHQSTLIQPRLLLIFHYWTDSNITPRPDDDVRRERDFLHLLLFPNPPNKLTDKPWSDKRTYTLFPIFMRLILRLEFIYLPHGFHVTYDPDWYESLMT